MVIYHQFSQVRRVQVNFFWMILTIQTHESVTITQWRDRIIFVDRDLKQKRELYQLVWLYH